MLLPPQIIGCKYCTLFSRLYHATRTNFGKSRGSAYVVPKKKPKPTRIWPNMTIYDLARSLKKDINYLNEVLKPTLAKSVELPSGRIKNFNAIKQFLIKNNVEYSVRLENAKKIETNEEDVSIEKCEQHVKNLVRRAPIVGIMGHVDHGKTTLLDALRNSNIVSSEFGGITQHIGAFSVSLKKDSFITFIDTPGHAAFSSLRTRGAQCTDIVILIVASDDGVMEQTVESIRMAQNAGVKIIVAVNKIDKGNHNLETIKQSLLEEGVQCEDLGGDVQVVPISALKRINLDLLIEAILVEAEVMELTGDPTAPFEGVVLEAKNTVRGKSATIVVRQGTLQISDLLVSGKAIAKVKALFDSDGQQLQKLTLSQAAEILGWRELPMAGEKVVQVSSEKEAKDLVRKELKKEMQSKQAADYTYIEEKSVESVAEFTAKKEKLLKLKSAGNKRMLHDFYMSTNLKLDKEEKQTDLKILVKGDVVGSVDAIVDVIRSYDRHDECKLSLLQSGVGVVTLSEIALAETFDATIYCFNLNYPQNLKDEIIDKKIKIRFHNIIYKLIDDLKSEISSKLPPMEVDEIIGRADVVQMFTINVKRKKVPVAGSFCTSGELRQTALFKVLRNEQVIYDGPINCLKHEKSVVGTINKGVHCGIMLQEFSGSFHPGDKIICYEKKKVPAVTSWNPGF